MNALVTHPKFKRSYYYKLVNREVIPCDVFEAEHQFKNPELRRVLESGIGPFNISTCFLVIDHNMGTGEPMLFETMVFLKDSLWREKYGENTPSPFEDYQTRCSTVEQAFSMHDEAMEKVSDWSREAGWMN